MIVYKITNLVNGKAYIGRTIQRRPKRRWNLHICNAKGGSDLPLHRAMRKYGVEAFRFELIYECVSPLEMHTLERALIAAHGTFAPRGYNLTGGGEGLTDRRISDAQRRVHSEHAKRQHQNMSAEERANRSALAKNMNASGLFRRRTAWKASAETRANMSAAQKGRAPPSAETRAKIAAAHTGDLNVMRRRPDVVAKSAAGRRGAKRTPTQVMNIRLGRRSTSKLTDAAIIDIKLALQRGESHASIAGRHGIVRQHVGKISAGECWGDIVPVAEEA